MGKNGPRAERQSESGLLLLTTMTLGGASTPILEPDLDLGSGERELMEVERILHSLFFRCLI